MRCYPLDCRYARRRVPDRVRAAVAVLKLSAVASCGAEATDRDCHACPMTANDGDQLCEVEALDVAFRYSLEHGNKLRCAERDGTGSRVVCACVCGRRIEELQLQGVAEQVAAQRGGNANGERAISMQVDVRWSPPGMAQAAAGRVWLCGRGRDGSLRRRCAMERRGRGARGAASYSINRKW